MKRTKEKKEGGKQRGNDKRKCGKKKCFGGFLSVTFQ
jgi:hypothetical protein